MLHVKERQFQDAITAALGVELSALADLSPTAPPEGGGRSGGRGVVATMTAPIPGQTFGVNVRLTNRGSARIQRANVLLGPLGPHPGFSIKPDSGQPSPLNQQQSLNDFFTRVGADDAPISTKPYFSRAAFTRIAIRVSDPIVVRRAVQSAATDRDCEVHD